MRSVTNMANEKENDQVRERLGKQKERTPGEIVAVCRKKKGWNQEELAYRCGILFHSSAESRGT